MRTTSIALRVACITGTLLTFTGCEADTLPPPGARLLDVVGDVRDQAGAPVAPGHVPTADTTYRVPLDAALTLVLANGCVVHARGPAEHAVAALQNLHTEPCPESVDEQVKLLRGFEGARSTLRERTAAAGLDALTVSDGPRDIGEKKVSREQVKVEVAATGGVASASEKVEEPEVPAAPPPPAETQGSKDTGSPAKGRKKAPTDGKDDDSGEPQPPQGKLNVAPEAPPPNAGSPPPATSLEKCVPSPGVACATPHPDWNSGPHEDPPLAIPKDMALVFVRSRALESLLKTPTHKQCVKDLGGDRVLHAVVSQQKIVDIRRLDGRQLGCHSLRGLKLAMPDGIAVAVIAPAK